ncbi:MAG: septum formation protein Maf [Clostridia bacterium]|nr:septum formation protein Maf [Clostridia bacterium]
MNYILASKSPRRKEILETLGLSFTVFTADTDESSEERDVCAFVEELSRRKGEAVKEALLAAGQDLADTVIISSDTVVAMGGEILGKPRDEKDACRMLRMYSGKRHQVVSGICLIGNGKIGVGHEVTEVEFEELDEETILRYVRSAKPYDKAGAYAIQGVASAYIKGIVGDYFNVVGLPVHRMNLLHREIFGENMF